MTPRRLGVLAVRRDTEPFTARERAALALAEAAADPADAFDRVSIRSRHPVRDAMA